MNAAQQAYFWAHREERVSTLALQLQSRGCEDAPFLLQQIEGWQHFREKVPTFAAVPDLHYPVRLSLQQCSSEAAARYKADIARRVMPSRQMFIDLTGGAGVDFAFLAAAFEKSIYIEQNAALCDLARHNFPLLGLPQAEVREGSSVEMLHALPMADLLLLDPARRDAAGRKTVRIEDCTPDAVALLPQLRGRARRLLLKLSPMLDVASALRALPGVEEVHVVGGAGECKEVLLLINLGKEETESRSLRYFVHCGDEHADFIYTAAELAAASPLMAASLSRFLYEPHPALMKAAPFRLISQRFGLAMLGVDAHLYTSETLQQDFPGRIFRVVDTFGFDKASLRRLRASVPKANITVRGFPATVADLRRRLHVAEGGESQLFATTLGKERILVLAERVITH